MRFVLLTVQGKVGTPEEARSWVKKKVPPQECTLLNVSKL